MTLGALAGLAPAGATAAVARLGPGAPPALSVEGRALAEIGFRVVPDGTPGALADPVGRSALVPNDPLYEFLGYGWVYDRTRFVDAWTQTTGDPTTIIAIVDTGVDPLTADLRGALLPGWDFYDNDADPSDALGHGTKMAALAAARTDNALGMAGACGRCSILPVRVANSDGQARWSVTAAGIVWAADHGARVISVSLVGPQSSPALTAAVAYAQGKDALVVAAAGNDSFLYSEYPAALPGVISVGASDANDALYPFSNHGSTVSLAAPGCAAVIGLGNQASGACGTSVSTPLVAGAAGLLRSSRPNASATQVASALAAGSSRVTDSLYGRLDVLASLTQLQAQVPAVRQTVAVAAPQPRRARHRR